MTTTTLDEDTDLDRRIPRDTDDREQHVTLSLQDTEDGRAPEIWLG